MSRVPMTVAAAGLVFLAGCAGPSVVQTSVDPTAQITSLYDYGAGGRDLRLVVQGNGFPGPSSGFVQAVEAAANVQTLRQPTHLTVVPGLTARPNFSVVLAFSAAPGIDGDALCRGGGDPVAPSGRVTTAGAFCVSGRAWTEAVGETVADGPNDPQFTRLIHQMMLALFRPDLNTGNDK